MLLDQIGQAQHDTLALGRPHAPPRPLECGARRGNGAIDILGPALGDQGQQLAGRRIARFKTLPRQGGHPLAVDQHILFQAVKRRRTIANQGRFHASLSRYL